MTTAPLHTSGTGLAFVNNILINERLRTDDAEIRIKIEEDLCPSIAEVGLLQPILLEKLKEPRTGININNEPITSDLLLIAGWSRLTAFNLLKYAQIPYNFREDTPDYSRDEMELEENLRRNDMRWQDVALSIRKIHFKRASLVAQANKGKSKSERLPEWGQRATGKLLGVRLARVNESLLLADYILKGDTEIIAAPSPFAARNILAQRHEDVVAAELAKKQQDQVNAVKRTLKPVHRVKTPSDSEPKAPDAPVLDRPVLNPNPTAAKAPVKIDLTHMLFNMDSIFPQEDGSPAFLSRLESESIDLIYTDPPFGIDMEDLEGRKDIERVADEHNVGENLDQMPVFFDHAYRILRDRGYFLQWCDMKNWDKFAGRMVKKKDKDGNDVWKHEKGWLERAGFTVCPYPVIWHKTHPCKNQASGVWPTKSFEYVCVARKGKGTLHHAMPQGVYACSGQAERKQQSNPFAKPFEFSKWLLDYFVKSGSTVLDCYAGEGSIVRALLNLNMTVIACEKKAIHFNRLVEHVKKHFRAQYGDNVEFI